MAKRFFNIEKHRFDIKQEVISKSSFWLAKKRYCQLIINKAGLPVDELEIKGIDVVRTGFPAIFRKFMKEFIVDILKKVDQRKIDDDIIKFLEDINTLSVVELAKNTSVKFISLDKTKNENRFKR
jgi:DNA polymerase elongation subunit (family B)